MRCLILVGYFSQKSPMISGSFSDAFSNIRCARYRAAKMREMPYSRGLFFAKEPYD